jgi:aminotransferase in exopolysaccharide biosynthesis
MFEEIIKFIKALYPNQSPISLHEPRFIWNEKKYLNQCIESTYVSYLGEFVGRFENMIQEFTGAKYAIATANGTLALHAALLLAGVKPGDEVLTQALTFVATANATMHCGAKPIFIDSDRVTLGMSPEKMEEFLTNEAIVKDDGCCYNKITDRKISACIPMHVFGHPVRIDEILNICNKHHITVIEDAAESLGSFYKEKHTGTFGKIGILSFNGNKIITTGGGGMIITNDEEMASKAKHITATAKIPHKWEFIHDEVGYNYRMPNVNAAIGCAQMESLPKYLDNKRETAALYNEYFNGLGVTFLAEPEESKSNYWLNAIILADREQREEFLDYSHKNGIMTRPIWRLMNKLPMYKDCQHTNLENAKWLEDRVVNVPSSVRI